MEQNELHIMYGNDIGNMTYELLEKLDIARSLRPDMRIALKPNFVVAKDASSGATTHPEIAEAVLRYLRAHGMEHISIMEGSWVGDQTKRAFQVCGYEKLSEKYHVPLYDLKDDKFVERQVGDLKLRICEKPLLETDYLIDLPVLKAHCQTGMTCAMKNLKGCLPDVEKRRLHELGLSKPIAYLAKVLRPQLILVDAICGDLTFEEGGNPVRMDRIIAGVDPVLVDTYGASLLGFAPEDVAYIKIAETIGVGSTDIASADIHEYNAQARKKIRFVPSDRAQRLAKDVLAENACSACYGSLIHALQRIQESGGHCSNQKIYIGQGFRGKSGDGAGIGSCTCGFRKSLAGCPPTAKAMVEFLRENS
jgi:uncharacterized protein (DUF362 family)